MKCPHCNSENTLIVFKTSNQTFKVVDIKDIGYGNNIVYTNPTPLDNMHKEQKVICTLCKGEIDYYLIEQIKKGEKIIPMVVGVQFYEEDEYAFDGQNNLPDVPSYVVFYENDIRKIVEKCRELGHEVRPVLVYEDIIEDPAWAKWDEYFE